MIGTAAAVFVVCSVLPLASMMAGALGSGLGTRTWLLDDRQRMLLYNTTVLGVGTAVLATLIGAPLGTALARVDVPAKGLVRVLLAAPVLVPPYIAGLAWVGLAGGTGLVADVIGRDVLSTWTYSLPGAVLILALVFYPFSMLATEVAVRRIEPRLEEAALLVARPRRVLWHITWRLAAPAVLAAALMIFVLAISEFGVPGLLRVRVFTTEVFTAFAALYDFTRATVLALPLLLLSMVVAALAVAIVGDQWVTTRRGTSAGDEPQYQAWKPGVVAAAACVVGMALMVPLVLLWREARNVRSWAGVVQGSSTAIGNSLLLAALGATFAIAVGLCLGHARARATRRLGAISDLTFVVLFAVPSTVVGVGLIGVWNRSGILGTLYGTEAMLVLACLARFLPVAALGLAAVVRLVPVSHEEAAATAGAGWARTMAWIVAPQVVAGLLAVWVIVFVLAFGELGASILVAPPGEATLPIRIYTLIANAPPAQVAALALLQSTVVLAPLLLLAWVVSRRSPR